MSTLIVPCAGRKFFNGKPKYLNRHPEGELLAKKTLEGLPIERFAEIIYVILKEDVEKYNAQEILLNELSDLDNVKIAILEHDTKGPAETVYLAVRKYGVTGAIVIKDLDNKIVITEDIIDKNFIVGLDLKLYNKDIFMLKNKSFIILNEQNNILSIEEKRICSETISVGLYGFRNAEEFCFSYRRLNDSSYPIENLYISHIISYMIGYSERVFLFYIAQEYESWGSEKEWNDVQLMYATYYINMDGLRLYDGSPEAKRNIDCLIKLSERGAKFVCTTSLGAESIEAVYQKLIEDGIRCIGLVPHCSYSSRKCLIENGDELYQTMLGVDYEISNF